MSKQSLPSAELLRKLLRYEPDTGLLFWRERDVEFFEDGYWKADSYCRTWNTQFSGKEALATNTDGYKTGVVLGFNLRSHRVIWAMENNKWPIDEVDHIDGVRHHNKMENLREVSSQENSCNSSIRSDNTSGTVGVYFSKVSGKWQAYIKNNGKSVYLGIYINKADAMEGCLNE